MNIYAEYGHKVVYLGCDDAQVNWGGGRDPRGILCVGMVYTVDHTEVHSMHTKVYLREFPTLGFNSVCFEDLEGENKPTLKDDLEALKELEYETTQLNFVRDNRFKIMREEIYQKHDVCPSCKGDGFTWHSCYHNDVEKVDCNRCATTGKYAEGNLTQFIKYLKEVK